MWDSLSPAWQACLEEAWMAGCAGSVPVGAVVTDAVGRIRARGRNRIFEAQGEDGCLHGQTLAHAEINALVTLPIVEVDRHTSTLYTTLEPCPLCMGAIYMSGVRQLRFAARDPYAGSVDMLGATPYLSRKPVQATGPERQDLEVLILALHTEFEYRCGLREGTRKLLEIWAAVVPEGVRLGEALFKNNELHRMREAGVSALEMVSMVNDKFRYLKGGE